jgi:signal transduction histidine kinase
VVSEFSSTSRDELDIFSDPAITRSTVVEAALANERAYAYARAVTARTSTGRERTLEELEQIIEEQAALQRIARLVAEGSTEAELAAAVTSEIGQLVGAHRANIMRLEADTIRVIGAWSVDQDRSQAAGLVFPFGGDTTTARIVDTSGPARVDSACELRSELARRLWAERGLHASIGAPIVVGGTIWGVVVAFRTQPDDPFPSGAELRLGDFAALVAQAVVNAEARRETAGLVAEQTALRRIATLVAGGRPQAEVLDAVIAEVAPLFEATTVTLVRWQGVQDEVAVVAAWCEEGTVPVAVGSLYHPDPDSATLAVLETGYASRSEETSRERGTCSVIAAPVITGGSLLGALTASRAGSAMFPAGAEIRLRSFADLAAQSIANERAQAELRASRARIVRAADEARQRLERNLHDGAQQRLVSLSVELRIALAKLPDAPEEARELLLEASAELKGALEELRDLARGLHPVVLTEQGLGPAIQALAGRMPLPVTVTSMVGERLPGPVEAAGYYVVSEALTNVVRYAGASAVQVGAAFTDRRVRIEVVDDGVGGAELDAGSGLRGLADRVEALGGSFGVDSPDGGGTRVWAEMPLDGDPV